MKCPECVASSQTSRVNVGMTVCTAMGYEEYYDEDGKPHTHDPNIRSTEFSCSNGHRWTESKGGTCWCGWASGTSVHPRRTSEDG